MTDQEPETEPEPEPGEDGTFPAEVVTRLRREAAERRVAARDAEEATSAANARLEALGARLLALEVADATRGVLADPTDLLAHVPAADLVDEEGNPSAERIKAAAAELVTRKAHLAPPTRPSGDVDQGARAPSAPVFDFADALRRAAR